MKLHSLRRTGACLLALSLLLGLLPAASAAEPNATVRINETAFQLPKGQSKTLTYTVEPQSETPSKIEWASSDTTVAAVETTAEGGKVTALKDSGTAEITVTLTLSENKQITSSPVTVTAAPEDTPPPAEDPVSGVELNRETLSLRVKGTKTLTASVMPETAKNKNVSWSSSDPAVASVNADGEVTGVSVGDAEITVTTEEGAFTAVCAVTVTPEPESVQIIPSVVQFNRGQVPTRAVSASVSPAASDQEVTWKSLDPSVATVDDKGLITRVAPGQTKIQAIAGDKIGECTVTVSGILLNTTSITILENKSENLFLDPSQGFGEAQGEGSLGWRTSDPTVVTVANGRITGRSVGEAVITADKNMYTAECRVKVVENVSGLTVLSNSYSPGKPLRFEDIVDELNDACQDALDKSSLVYITNLSVPTHQGVLYHGYLSAADTGSGVAVTDKYYVSKTIGQSLISNVTFVPKADYSGTIEISYTGYNSRKEFYAGRIRLTAEGEDEVSYSTVTNNPVIFQSDDFNHICRLRTGRELSYVTFELPQSSRGTLYYNYNKHATYQEKVTANTQYYRTRSPELDEVAFLPASGYTGTVRITYRGVDTAGASFSGHVIVAVNDYGGDDSGNVNYSARQGDSVDFKAGDFNDACRELLGESLDYVRFTLPKSSVGTLYYNYRSSGTYDSRVSENTRYRRSGSPSLSNVTFVPAAQTDGQVQIDFTGYGTSGERFEGTVVIQYDGDNEEGDVPYSVRSGGSVSFEASDFNEVCRDITGRTLYRIRFTSLPQSTRGTLYYNYRNSSNTGSRVSLNTNYYRSSSPSISSITFVPKSGYTGTATAAFTAYDSSGDTFKGTVTIRISEGSGSSNYSDDVSYSVRSGGAVTFDAVDFDDVCEDKTGSTLNYVRFKLPDKKDGLLCYNYNSSRDTYSSEVKTTTNYYRTGGSYTLSKVTFLAEDDCTGTVSIPYTAYSRDGDHFNGTVEIQVTTPSVNPIYYSSSDQAITLNASDFTRVCQAGLDRSLSYIQFTSLPTSGGLYLNYNSANQTGSRVTTGTRYYVAGSPNINQISYVPQYGYQGTFSLTYTGSDSSGDSVTGRVEFSMTGVTQSSFQDMGNHGWANNAVEYLYGKGVISGIGDHVFGPGLAIRRCDFVIMLCNAFSLTSSETDSFPDVPADSYYAKSVATAKHLGITSGSDGKFHPTSLLTRQDAMLMIQKAMQVTGWSVADGSSVDLTGFKDHQEIAPYARAAIGTMVRLQAVSGDDNGCLRPNSSISRGEMAVILYRVMTL